MPKRIVGGVRYKGRAKTIPLTVSKPSPWEGEVSLQFMGTNAIALTDGSTTILIDPYFSRVDYSLLVISPVNGNDYQAITGNVSPIAAQVAQGLDRAGLINQEVQALFFTHSHFDHAMDANLFADQFVHAQIYGNQSLTQILERDKQDRYTQLGTDVVYVGDFSITPRKGAHIHLPGHYDQLLAGPIQSPVNPPVQWTAYKGGEEQFFFEINHPKLAGPMIILGSGNVPDGVSFPADTQTVLLPVGGYFRTGRNKDIVNMMSSLVKDVPSVLFSHWDEFDKKLFRQNWTMPHVQMGLMNRQEIKREFIKGESDPAKRSYLPLFNWVKIS